MVEALSEADRFFLNLAFKRAKERQSMSKRTIDETGKDVLQQRGRQVREMLAFRPDPITGREAEWLPLGETVPEGWTLGYYMRTRIILDNET